MILIRIRVSQNLARLEGGWVTYKTLGMGGRDCVTGEGRF